MEFTAEKGCKLAHSDCHHDFSGQKGLERYDEAEVNAYIPESRHSNCAVTEDQFFKDYIFNIPAGGSSVGSVNRSLTPSAGSNIITELTGIFKPEFADKYKMFSVNRQRLGKEGEGEDDDDEDESVRDPYKRSFIEDVFQAEGLTDDVFFISDTATHNIMEDLASVRSQNFYWIQNAQTLYDPASKTTHDTKAGKRYGFRDESKKFTFCWEKLNSPPTIYPAWEDNKETYAIDDNNKEIMFYSNRKLYMSIFKEDSRKPDTDYTNHNSHLLITYPKTPALFAYADSSLASKTSSITDIGGTESVKATALKDYIHSLLRNTESAAWSRYQRTNMANKFLAKHLGDAGQALAGLKTNIKLQRYVKKNDKNSGVVDFESNNLIAFISFDRLAIASAILYNCKIIVHAIISAGSKCNSFIVYIRKDLLDPKTNLLSLYESKKINDTFSKFPLFYSPDYKTKYTNFNSNVERFKRFLMVFNLSSDRDYSLLLAIYQHFINTLFLLSSVHVDDSIIKEDIILNRLLRVINEKRSELKRLNSAIDLEDKTEYTATVNIDQLRSALTSTSEESDINELILGPLNNNVLMYTSQLDEPPTTASEARKKRYKEKMQKNNTTIKRAYDIVIETIGRVDSIFKELNDQFDLIDSVNAQLDYIPSFTPKRDESDLKALGLKLNAINEYKPYVSFASRQRVSRTSTLDDEVNKRFGVEIIKSIISIARKTQHNFGEEFNAYLLGELDNFRSRAERSLLDSDAGDYSASLLEKFTDVLNLNVTVGKKSSRKGGGLINPSDTDSAESLSILLNIAKEDINQIQLGNDSKDPNMVFSAGVIRDTTVRDLSELVYNIDIFIKGFINVLLLLKINGYYFDNEKTIFKNVYEYLFSTDKPPTHEEKNVLERYIDDVKNMRVNQFYYNTTENIIDDNIFTFSSSNVNINKAIYNYINFSDERLTNNDKKIITRIFGIRHEDSKGRTFHFPKELEGTPDKPGILLILADKKRLTKLKAVMNFVINYSASAANEVEKLISENTRSRTVSNRAVHKNTFKNPTQNNKAISVKGGKAYRKYFKQARKTRKIRYN